MNIMTKRGSEDNIITYEHYCDTKADLANIPQDQISLGSVAIVLKDEDDSMGIYLANSNKEWISFSTGGGGGGSGMSDGGDIMSQVNWIKVIDNAEVTFTNNYVTGQISPLITVEQFLLPFQFIKVSIDQNEIAEYAVCADASYDDETNFRNVRYVNYNVMGDFFCSVTNVAKLAQEDTGMLLTEFKIEDLRAEDAYQEGDTATVSLWLGTLVELPE